LIEGGLDNAKQLSLNTGHNQKEKEVEDIDELHKEIPLSLSRTSPVAIRFTMTSVPRRNSMTMPNLI
jgi:hypothetical protein